MDDRLGLINKPPKRVPSRIDITVADSIQLLAIINFSGGNNSVNIPYFAGEYDAAPNPTIA